MAASQEQKVDYLLKKIGYSASKTGIAEDSSLSGTKKAPYEEPIPSPLIIPGTIIWSQSQNIPTIPPATDTVYVKAYAPGISSYFQMTVDGTVTGNRTFVARQSVGVSTSTNIGDWVDTQFGSDYNIKVYRGNPTSGGVQLSAAGSGSNDTWFFDYSSGVLNFNGSVVPTGVLSNNIYIVGWRYIGAKGVLSEGGQGQTNLSVANLNVSGISTLSTIKISSGIVSSTTGVAVTFIGNLTGTASYATTAGVSTTSTNVIGGIASVSSLFVDTLGISTLGTVKISSGIITSSNPGVTTVTFVGNLIGTASTASFATTAFTLNGRTESQLNVAFATTATNVIGGIASVSSLFVDTLGISTLGTVKISSGIITSSNPGVTTVTFVGNLTGTASTASFATTAANLGGFTAQNLSVAFAATAGIATNAGYATTAGISTNVIGGIASVSSLFVNTTGISTLGTVKISSGIITSSNPGFSTVTYFGDGSNLSGIRGVTVELQSQTTQTLFLTLASNSGVSSIGIATAGSTSLSFIPSTGFLGIGTTNPTSKLTVNGDVFISGITTIGAGNTGVVINAGIVTSISGFTTVTFVGNLTGTASTASFATTSFTLNGRTESQLNVAFAQTAGISTNVIGGIGSITQLSVSGVTTSGEFIGGGSDLRNLQGTHLVSYSSYSESSNSSTSISGISTYNRVGMLTAGIFASSNDNFGFSVASSSDGKTIIVGAKNDELSGITGNGLVYVFDRVGNSFNQIGILTGSNANESGDNFGISVASSADGKTIVVGASADETVVSNSGLVYVFDRVGNSFNQVGILTGSNAGSTDLFGISVATSADGKTIVVGASADELSGSTGNGLVYVFDRVGNSFNQVGILTGSNAVNGNENFGFAVTTSADGKSVIVGAKNDGLPASTNTGLVYVFDRVGNSFNQVGILTGSNSVSSGNFGISVATSADGKTILSGASQETFSGSGDSSGIAYVFDRVGSSFNQVAVLTGVYATDLNDNYGNSVSISADGKKIIVAALNDEVPSGGTNSGVVYSYSRVGNSFNRVGIFTGTFGVLNNFGSYVASSADGKSIIVGAQLSDTNIAGSGAAFVFDEVKETYLHSNSQGNIGIGTSNPTSKLEVLGGDIRVGINTSQGVILTSPDGTRYRLIVANGGALSTVLVP